MQLEELFVAILDNDSTTHAAERFRTVPEAALCSALQKIHYKYNLFPLNSIHISLTCVFILHRSPCLQGCIERHKKIKQKRKQANMF